MNINKFKTKKNYLLLCLLAISISLAIVGLNIKKNNSSNLKLLPVFDSSELSEYQKSINGDKEFLQPIKVLKIDGDKIWLIDSLSKKIYILNKSNFTKVKELGIEVDSNDSIISDCNVKEDAIYCLVNKFHDDKSPSSSIFIYKIIDNNTISLSKRILVSDFKDAQISEIGFWTSKTPITLIAVNEIKENNTNDWIFLDNVIYPVNQLENIKSDLDAIVSESGNISKYFQTVNEVKQSNDLIYSSSYTDELKLKFAIVGDTQLQDFVVPISIHYKNNVFTRAKPISISEEFALFMYINDESKSVILIQVKSNQEYKILRELPINQILGFMNLDDSVSVFLYKNEQIVLENLITDIAM